MYALVSINKIYKVTEFYDTATPSTWMVHRNGVTYGGYESSVDFTEAQMNELTLADAFFFSTTNEFLEWLNE